MARKNRRALKVQKFALGTFAAVALAIIGWLFWMTARDAPLGEFVEGEHYQLLENPRRIRGGEVEVMEFFSYACPHCYNLEPLITDWAAGKKSIKFIQMPAVSTDNWRLLGRHYLTLRQLDLMTSHHQATFRSIHDAGRFFASPQSLFDYVATRGIDQEAYKAAFNSTEVSNELNRADQMGRRLKVAAVPSVVVQGKYLVRTSSTVGTRRMLEVMDYLIEKELSGESEQAEDAGNQNEDS